jgi:hypothetical protein
MNPFTPLFTKVRGRGILRTSPFQNSRKFITLGMRSAYSAISSNLVKGVHLELRLYGVLGSSPQGGLYWGGLRSSRLRGPRCQPHVFLASLTMSITDSTESNIDRANAATQNLIRNCPTTRIRPPLPAASTSCSQYTHRYLRSLILSLFTKVPGRGILRTSLLRSSEKFAQPRSYTGRYSYVQNREK